jgi:hypothetical protein
MTTPTMCEAECGSTCWCDWEECLGVYDDDMFLDKGLKQLTNCVYYQTEQGGYAVVGDQVYQVRGTHTEGWDVHLLDGHLLVQHDVSRRSLFEPYGDYRWMDWTMVKFVQSKEISLPSILKG